MPDSLISGIFAAIIFNIPLYAFFKKTFHKDSFFILHKVLSAIDILVFTLLVLNGLYKINPYFAFIAPMLVGYYCMLGYGLNEEISDAERASLVTPGMSQKMKMHFIEIVIFPGYYVVKSWKDLKKN